MTPNTPRPGELTMSQQFRLNSVRREVKDMPLDAAHAYVIEATRLLMLKDNYCKELIREKMGVANEKPMA